MIEALQNIDALKNSAAVKSRPVKMPSDDPIPQRPSEQQLGEAASLSAAIQRLITERDHHRGRVGAQEHELTRLRTVNEELRRQNERMALVRDHYLQLATEVLTTLKAHRRHNSRGRAKDPRCRMRKRGVRRSTSLLSAPPGAQRGHQRSDGQSALTRPYLFVQVPKPMIAASAVPNEIEAAWLSL